MPKANIARIFGEDLEVDKSENVESVQRETLQNEVARLNAAINANNQTIATLNQRIEKMAADLAFDGELIAAKGVKIAKQAEELAQLKDFISKVSERLAQGAAQPQPQATSPPPQSDGLCAKCGFQNVMKALYCRQCGTKLATSPGAPKLPKNE